MKAGEKIYTKWNTITSRSCFFENKVEGPDNSRSLNGMIKAHVVNLVSQRRVVDTMKLVVFQPYFYWGCDADVV